VSLRYKRRALGHLHAIHRYIAKNNPAAAKRVIERIEQSVAGLSHFPFTGRPGVVKGTRLLSVPGLPYIVVYRVRGEVVDILAVLHAARRRRS
jgi:toxin ParE1/3/4